MFYTRLSQFRVFHLFRTDITKEALVTMRTAGCADVTTMQQEPVMGTGNVLYGDVLHELTLYLQLRVIALADQS